MMWFDPYLAQTRFGVGLSPRIAGPVSVDDMMARLMGEDVTAKTLPVASFANVTPSPQDFVAATRARRNMMGTDGEQAAQERVRDLRRAVTATTNQHALTTIARNVITHDGLRERLVAFWADHFTAKARRSQDQHLVTPYVEDAIRPHVAGRFPDMLRAVATHPVMLTYLQQTLSHGPNSKMGQKRGRGLNENLAREMLELHTIGVSGRYAQSDVIELAELLTGLTYHPDFGFRFDPQMAEPGAETVLGVKYAELASMDSVFKALDDLAMNPDTATHLAQKLVIHFVSDTPSPALVAEMSGAYLRSDGDVSAMVQAMLTKQAAWTDKRTKVRRPLEFISASLRALEVSVPRMMAISARQVQNYIYKPLRIMGQPWENPVGPDGWSEQARDWIIPQAMAGRISWAMKMPAEFRRDLPDPRDFVVTALGPKAPEVVTFAATAASGRREGIGVILASAAFQRR